MCTFKVLRAHVSNVMLALFLIQPLLHVTSARVAAAAAFGLSGTLRLQEHSRISHDTYLLASRPHPHNRKRLVHGYAFLNLHASKLPHNGLIHRDKHHHFRRNLTTHESNRSHTAAAAAAAAHYHNQHHKHSSSSSSTNDTAQSHSRKRNTPSSTLPTCTGPISEGTAWKTSRGYYIHTRNRNGLSGAFVVDAVQRANDAWHCGTAAFEKLIEGPLLGVVNGSSGATIDLSAPDGVNEVGFASIQGHPGTVAVTIVWGTFDGPLDAREIIEYDMVFDGEHYAWGDAAENPRVMDLLEIATHETGHSYGLDDIYDGACSDVTMFGTSVEGETAKRSLTRNDLGGLSLLYGALAPVSSAQK